MKLNSPNTDPYAKWRKTKKDMKSDGFSEAITVLSATQARSGDQFYEPEDFRIEEVHRFLERDSYLSYLKKTFVPKVLLGLQAKDGEKYILEYFFHSPYQEAVMEFAAKVDRVDNRQQLFQKESVTS